MYREVKAHLDLPNHPIAKLVEKFHICFADYFDQFVDAGSASKGELMERIQKQGANFIQRTFDNVKSFQNCIFDALVFLYDPNFKGVLESVEREIDDLLCDLIVSR